MNFNAVFLKSFRILLLPFALLYGLIIIIRNWLYDKKIIQSAAFNFPLICVGNLAVGGTGKSPMVEYLAGILRPDFKIATLSRGYKRKTIGYVLADENTTALEIGDEPMQFHNKFPDIAVAVGEERIVAIPQILHDHPDLEVIILDDAFQHRVIRAGFNILLTDCSNLYTRDFFLPTGDLRDEWRSANRCQVVIVTKCPSDLSSEKKRKITQSLRLTETQKVFFTSIKYGQPYHIYTKELRSITSNDEVLLVCGIANPAPLKEYLLQTAYTYYQKEYNDHHIFSIDDLNEIREWFERIDAGKKMIITTEKDAVRLIKYSEELKELPLYVLPIQPEFLFNEAEQFDAMVVSFIRNFSFNPNA